MFTFFSSFSLKAAFRPMGRQRKGNESMMGIKLWRKCLLGLWDDRKSNVDTSGGCKLFPTVDQWTAGLKEKQRER